MSIYREFRDQMVAALMAADDEKLAKLHRLFTQPPVQKPKAKRGGAAAPKVTVVPAFPEGEGIPKPADYRLKPETIDTSVCVGRTMKSGVDDDKRWSPAVYREKQCGRAVESGHDICAKCAAAAAKAAETGKGGSWNGRVTEAPPAWSHMLGTAWAAKCKWVGPAESESESESDSESE